MQQITELQGKLLSASKHAVEIQMQLDAKNSELIQIRNDDSINVQDERNEDNHVAQEIQLIAARCAVLKKELDAKNSIISTLADEHEQVRAQLKEKFDSQIKSHKEAEHKAMQETTAVKQDIARVQATASVAATALIEAEAKIVQLQSSSPGIGIHELKAQESEVPILELIVIYCGNGCLLWLSCSS